MLRVVLALPLFFAACQKDETVSGYSEPDAVYLLQEIDGVAVGARATLTFPQPGVIAGQAPCNSYSGKQVLPYPWFGVEAVAVTRRACPELAAEAVFFTALQAMTLAEVAGGVLILSNDAGGQMVFRAD